MEITPSPSHFSRTSIYPAFSSRGTIAKKILNKVKIVSKNGRKVLVKECVHSVILGLVSCYSTFLGFCQ